MGTITAQILIGEAHPNHGGIYPTHVLYLSENSRPSWILTEHNILVESTGNQKPIIWNPTVENMLEDALLMISYYVMKNPLITATMHSALEKSKKPYIQLYEAFEQEELPQLYAINKQISCRYKLVINVFEGSTILQQLKVLEEYGMEVEVTIPVYSRSFSRWRNQMGIKGSLSIEA
ncbi:hypothetical protein [Brevibacillus sp. H7]|uniref:hypothetical protein n=1 Tax=Brevibacillus sp. H7 TaxID=3349138 RepID=UPI00381AF6C1